LIPASVPRFKKDLRDLTDYLASQVKKAGVQINLGRDASAENIVEAGPDVVIVATGATHIIPSIPGAEKEKVCTAIELFSGKKECGQNVMVMGGGLVGCEAAAYLAQGGREVTVVELLDRILKGENRANQQQMIKMLAEGNVEVFNRTRVTEITAQGVVIDHGGEIREIEADSIVIAVGMTAISALHEDLKDMIPETYAIGDCVKPRRIMDAIWEGFRIARLI